MSQCLDQLARISSSSFCFWLLSHALLRFVLQIGNWIEPGFPFLSFLCWALVGTSFFYFNLLCVSSDTFGQPSCDHCCWLISTLALLYYIYRCTFFTFHLSFVFFGFIASLSFLAIFSGTLCVWQQSSTLNSATVIMPTKKRSRRKRAFRAIDGCACLPACFHSTHTHRDEIAPATEMQLFFWLTARLNTTKSEHVFFFSFELAAAANSVYINYCSGLLLTFSESLFSPYFFSDALFTSLML